MNHRATGPASTRAMPHDAPRLPFEADAIQVDANHLDPVAAPEFIRHPRARRYVLRVGDDGRVRVTIPRWGSKRDAQAFAESQRAWVARQQQRLITRRAEEERARTGQSEAERTAREQFLRDARLRARTDLPDRLRELAAQLGLVVNRISVRNQKWRWGSCSRAGHICLNWRLAAMPPWVRDYVLIHELMHLRRMDHSPRFWKLVESACPQYRDARAWLRQHGESLR